MTRCWNILNQASAPAAEPIFKISAPVSRARSASVRRIVGSGDLWVTEFILMYDNKPSYTVSIMEFKGDKVARETQYFADPFAAPAFRAQWVERMDA